MGFSLFRTGFEPERLRRSRGCLSAVRAALGPYDGKHKGRLSDSTIAKLRDAIRASEDAGVDVLPQWVEGRSRGGRGQPIIDLSGLRDEIARLDGLIHAAEQIQSLPVDEYVRQFERYREASDALHKAAEERGIARHELQRFIRVPQFSP